MDGDTQSQRPTQHGWDVTPEEAVAIQQRLRGLVATEPRIALEDVRTIAGVDAAYKGGPLAAIVVLSFPELEVIERVTARRDEEPFPYVPGLLSFREIPVVLDAYAKLTTSPDVLMCDGQGIAHPRGLGIASHLGIYLNKPSVGCAKSRLVGTHPEVGPQPGESAPLTYYGRRVGTVLRSKARSNPLYISVGHALDLATAVALVQRCLRGYRLPEPTRLADALTHAA